MRVLDGQTVSPSLAAVLEPVDIVLVGLYIVPEQTPPSQARMQFEEQAKKALEGAAEVFDDHEESVEKHLVFSGSEEESVQRLVAEHGADGYIIPNPVTELNSVVFAIPDDVADGDIERLVRVASGLFTDVDSVLVRVVGDDDEQDATVVDRLVNGGISRDNINVEHVSGIDTAHAITEESSGSDAIVMVRTPSTIVTRFLGDNNDRVARSSLSPVFVIGRGEDTEE